MANKKLYVIGNSHMDPIWLWRMREGKSTWLNTCRSVVRIMKKYPDLKFSRSSSACYKHIEESDPELFREIAKLIEAGRWEIVGGWVEQSDTIITPGESLIRQAEHGQRYFREKFGITPEIAYSVDSFGQNAGLPKILNKCGFKRYVWMRPSIFEKEMPNRFRWVADDGESSVTSFRIQYFYCTSPLLKTKDQFIYAIEQHLERGPNQTFFFGVGDHGGWLYEDHLKILLELAEQYDIEFSTLDNYFKVMEQETLPEVKGEFTHHAPGCYSAVSSIKRNMSRGEKTLFKAEKILLESGADGNQKLDNAWEEFLFNYFHDIYPGSSIKDSMENEVRDICGYTTKIAADLLDRQLSRYASKAKTDFLTEGGILAWNPLPQPVTALIRFDTFPDPNLTGSYFDTLTAADGETIPLQWCRGVSSFGPVPVWGKAVATVKLPPSGMKIFAYGRTNAERESLGFERQNALLERIEFSVLSDPHDTWAHSAKDLGELAGKAELISVEQLEDGPVASCLRARYQWNDSVFRADIFAYKGIDELEIIVSGTWLKVKEDLKLTLRTGISDGKIISGQASTILEREPDLCEQPFIDWCAAAGNGKYAGFLADHLHSYDSIGSESLRITILRPVYYAEHTPHKPTETQGTADTGEFEIRLWFKEGEEAQLRSTMPRAARERLWSAEHLEITAAADGTGFQRDIWSVEPAEITVSAQYVNMNGETEFHLNNPMEVPAKTSVLKNGEIQWEGTLVPGELRLLRLPQK